MIVIYSVITLAVAILLFQSILSSIVLYMNTGHTPFSFLSRKGIGHCQVNCTIRKKRLKRLTEILSEST